MKEFTSQNCCTNMFNVVWRCRRLHLWPVFELWCFPGSLWFMGSDSVVKVLVSALAVHTALFPQHKGWKMLARCFMCLSGSTVPLSGDTEYRLDLSPSPLHSDSSFCATLQQESEASTVTPAAAAAIIESKQDEVMTDCCPLPLSFQLQLRWCRLKGRVH